MSTIGFCRLVFMFEAILPQVCDPCAAVCCIRYKVLEEVFLNTVFPLKIEHMNRKLLFNL